MVMSSSGDRVSRRRGRGSLRSGFSEHRRHEHTVQEREGRAVRGRDGRDGHLTATGGIDFSGCKTDSKTGFCCVEVEETVTTLKKDPILECTHKNVEKCHYTYVTQFDPTSEEVCQENFEKTCQITFKQEANEEEVKKCYRPLTKTCSGQGPEVCQTVYESSCTTKYIEKQPGKFVGDTKCEKLPIDICGAGCTTDEGPEECHDKKVTSLVDIPEEVCDLNPQKICKFQTRLVPKLKPEHECTIIPQEVCNLKFSNPEVVDQPLKTKWCQDPTAPTPGETYSEAKAQPTFSRSGRTEELPPPPPAPLVAEVSGLEGEVISSNNQIFINQFSNNNDAFTQQQRRGRREQFNSQITDQNEFSQQELELSNNQITFSQPIDRFSQEHFNSQITEPAQFNQQLSILNNIPPQVSLSNHPVPFSAQGSNSPLVVFSGLQEEQGPTNTHSISQEQFNNPNGFNQQPNSITRQGNLANNPVPLSNQESNLPVAALSGLQEPSSNQIILTQPITQITKITPIPNEFNQQPSRIDNIPQHGTLENNPVPISSQRSNQFHSRPRQGSQQQHQSRFGNNNAAFAQQRVRGRRMTSQSEDEEKRALTLPTSEEIEKKEVVAKSEGQKSINPFI